MMCTRMDWNGKRQRIQARDSYVRLDEKALVSTLEARGEH